MRKSFLILPILLLLATFLIFTGYRPTYNGCDSSSGGASGDITGASCSVKYAEEHKMYEFVYEAIETIKFPGNTYDGKCKIFVPIGLGDSNQEENQAPVFRVENGGTLKNVIISGKGANSIHLYNSATLDNITWEDVREDACTVKSSGTYTVKNITVKKGSDNFFQINTDSALSVSNAIIHDMGKALSQNGSTTFKINVTFDRCEIENMKEGIFRTDSRTSKAKIINSRLRNAGDTCIGNWASCTQSNISYY